MLEGEVHQKKRRKTPNFNTLLLFGSSQNSDPSHNKGKADNDSGREKEISPSSGFQAPPSKGNKNFVSERATAAAQQSETAQK